VAPGWHWVAAGAICPPDRCNHAALAAAPPPRYGRGVSETLPFPRNLHALGARHPRWAVLALGLCATLALPPLHLVPALLVAIPGLIWLLGRAPGWRQAALLGFLWAWAHHVAGVYWVTSAILKDVANFWWLVPLAAPALAVPMALFSVPAAILAWWLPPGWQRLLGFAAAFVAGELLRGWAFTGFPWNLIGSVWAFAALPIQAASVIGVHGLSLLTLLLAGLPLLGRRCWLAGGGLMLLLAGFGLWRLSGPEAAAPGIRLLLVQGNIAQEMKWEPAQRRANFQRYLDLTAAAAGAEAAAHPDQPLAVIWPETASPFLLAQDPEAMRLAAATLPANALLLGGTVRAEWQADGRLAQVWNSLVVLNPRGEVLSIYDKSHLVPFGEYSPLSGLLPVRLAAGGSGGADFGAGPGPTLMRVPGLPDLGALICYEVIFPGAVAPTPRPQWLVNITNDSWFGESAGPWQHVAAARLRAVEEGLPLVRAAQSGISAVFDSHGRRLAMLGLGQAGTLAAALPAAGPATGFSRVGLWLPGSTVILTLCSLLVARVRRSPRRTS
jgi:apolipoprotein N-acyltransferase